MTYTVSSGTLNSTIPYLRPRVCAEIYMKLHYFVTVLSRLYKVVCVHTSGEVDAHCAAFILVATGQIWWKFLNSIHSYCKKMADFTFLWTQGS